MPFVHACPLPPRQNPLLPQHSGSRDRIVKIRGCRFSLGRERLTAQFQFSDSNDQEKWRRIEGDEEEEEATRGNE